MRRGLSELFRPGPRRTLMTTLVTGHETPYARVREISGSVET